MILKAEVFLKHIVYHIHCRSYGHIITLTLLYTIVHAKKIAAVTITSEGRTLLSLIMCIFSFCALIKYVDLTFLQAQIFAIKSMHYIPVNTCKILI